MAELNVRFDVRLNQNHFRWTLAALFVALSAAEVGSESVTLNTYYPAPSGVYNYMITTQDTYLARDSKNVTIGGTGTAGLSKLSVAAGAAIGSTYYSGTAAPTNGLIVQGQVGVGTNAPSRQLHVVGANPTTDGIIVEGTATSMEIQLKRGVGSTLKGTIANSASALTYGPQYIADALAIGSETNNMQFFTKNGAIIYNPLSFSGINIGIGGVTSPVSTLDVGNISGDGIATARQSGSLSCSLVKYGNGLTNCPANYYATLVSGVYANDWALGAIVFASVSGGQGTMLCCACPSGAPTCGAPF